MPAATGLGATPVAKVADTVYDASESIDRQLVTEAKRGSHDAYRQLVERHQQKIFAFCCRWLDGDEEEAREACQDTFVRAHDALPRFHHRPQARFTSWLFRIALNLCRDRLRSVGFRKRLATTSLHLENGPLPPCGAESPDQAMELREEWHKLQQGVDALPEKLREALWMTTIDGFSHRRCGEILGCSERAVEGRVRRARHCLIEWWRRNP